MGTYAWLITRDHLHEEAVATGGRVVMDDEAGTVGPRGADQALLNRLTTGQGFEFEMRDDDGIPYYTGRLLTIGEDGAPVTEEECIAPLRDYGRPNAGCTSIHWKDHPEWDCG